MTPTEREVLMRRAFDRTTLAQVRADAQAALLTAGVDLHTATWFVYAVNEGMINAIRHGAGAGDLTLTRQDGVQLLAEVFDPGHAEPFTVPTARPGPLAEGGRGLWTANELCDWLNVRTGVDGTTILLGLMLKLG